MDTIAESAARLCDADDAVVRRLEGGRFYAVSQCRGAIPMVSGIGVDTLCDRSTPAGRAVLEKADDSRAALARRRQANIPELKPAV